MLLSLHQLPFSITPSPESRLAPELLETNEQRFDNVVFKLTNSILKNSLEGMEGLEGGVETSTLHAPLLQVKSAPCPQLGSRKLRS